MKVQFEWCFEDETDEKKNTASRKNSSRRSSELVWRYWKRAQNGVPAGGTVFDAGLTLNQRRLHAALARAKPWFCPSGQPEPFVRAFGWQHFPGRIVNWLACFRSRVTHRPDQNVLTSSQRRLHAALARTRPWSCPDPRPE